MAARRDQRRVYGTWERALTGVVCVGTVALLTLVVVAADGPTSLDLRLSTWVADHRTPWLVTLMEVVTVAGSAVAIWLVAAVCAAWGSARSDWRPLWFVIPTALAASLTTNLMKLAIARPRPGGDIALRDFSGYSFPSGHATTAAALWGAPLAVLLVGAGLVRPRVAVVGWIGVTVLVSASRIVLGAHWLTDVVAGTAVGAGCVVVAALVARLGGVGRSPRSPASEIDDPCNADMGGSIP